MLSVSINDVTYTNVKEIKIDKEMIVVKLNDSQTLITLCKDVIDVSITDWS